MKTTHTPENSIPSFRHDYRTGQYVPTLNGLDISPTSFDRERAIAIAQEAAEAAIAKASGSEVGK